MPHGPRMEVLEMITREEKAIPRALVLLILTVLMVSQSGTCVLYEDSRGRYTIRFPMGWT